MVLVVLVLLEGQQALEYLVLLEGLMGQLPLGFLEYLVLLVDLCRPLDLVGQFHPGFLEYLSLIHI